MAIKSAAPRLRLDPKQWPRETDGRPSSTSRLGLFAQGVASPTGRDGLFLLISSTKLPLAELTHMPQRTEGDDLLR